MQTRREQAQAYAFVARRLTAALTAADPNAVEHPTHRLARAAFLSVMVAVLAVAGVTIYGYLRPGNSTSWQAQGTLILENETDTRYVYAGGVLHPVLNYASAQLALGSAHPTVKAVSARSLAGVPRGAPIGIPGAPDDLPPASGLAHPPWTACTQPVRDSGATLAAATVLSGGVPTGGTAVPAGSGLLVSAPTGELSLVWQGHRLRLAEASARTALGYDTASPMPLSAAVLSVIPTGPPLRSVPVNGGGGAGPSIAGQPGVLGRVYQTDAGQNYLLVAGGLTALTPLQAQLQLAGPGYPSSDRTPVHIGSAAAAQATLPQSSTVDGTAPSTPPRLVSANPQSEAVCATYDDAAGASDGVQVWVRPAAVEGMAGTYTEPVDALGGPLADELLLPAGGAALVRELPAPGLSVGTVYLVTSLGVKYPLADSDTATLLGYANAAPTPLPASYVQLLRTGPTLSKADAARTVPVQPGPSTGP